jgi:hypothetical protein
VRGNYCTLNPLSGGGSADPTNGNLDQTVSGASLGADTGTFLLTTGKWYWEITSTLSTNDAAGIGILRANLPAITFFTTNPSGVYYYVNGDKYIDGTGSAYGATWNTLGTAFNIAVALDVDGGTVTFYKNGVSQGAITLPSNTNGWLAHSGFGSASGSMAANFNFGQRPFAYTAPSGFKALVTTNLPEPTVVQGDDYFNTVLYTGTGASQSITGVGFQPDFVWIKNRGAAYVHVLFDVVRGSSGGYFNKLVTSTTAGESLYAQGAFGAVTALNSDGFTVDSSNSDWNQTNASGTTYVAWNWKADGAGVSNTAGTITSTVSANTIAGISIVTWTGNSSNADGVGHGLGVAPKIVIYKKRNGTSSWYVWTTVIDGSNDELYLEQTAAAGAVSAGYGNITSTTISNYGWTTSDNMVAYCFAEVEGFSKFGSYTGNDDPDGPFVYTGFRPAFLMIKNSSATQPWVIIDATRSAYNVAANKLYPNASDAENSTSTDNSLDILSNGFKLRGDAASNDATNGPSNILIYAAFAEFPFRNALAR